jgi:uroporphyrinogen-III synthase
MPEATIAQKGFQGLRVLSLESRRAREMAQLIANSGGQPTVAPSTRDVPIEDQHDALKFVQMLREGRVDVIVFLTGVGVRTLAQAADTVCPRPEFVAALSKITVIARGPKPVGALRELAVPIAATVPEPNTWRELLQLLDEKRDELPISGRTVAVQEYGVPPPELLAGLAERGAQVVSVRTYEWRLPEDTAPLREAVQAVIRGEIDILLVTSGVQVRHFLQIAGEMGSSTDLIHALQRVVVSSIGPVASAELRQQGIAVDLEPSHPKMGFLVQETAQRSAALIQSKRP